MHLVDRGQGAKLAQQGCRAGRKLQARGVGAVDDVDVVVAGQDQSALGQARMPLQGRQELGPFPRAARVRLIARDENEVERLLGMHRVEPGQHSRQPLIAAWTGPAALQAEAVAFAHHVDVGKVRHAPSSCVWRQRVERRKIPGLVHRRVCETPNERSSGEVSAHDHAGVGQRLADQPNGRREVIDMPDPARGWPDEQGDAHSDPAQDDAGCRRTCRAYARRRRRVVPRQHVLRQSTQQLPAKGVRRLHGHAIQRPEPLLGDAKQRPSSQAIRPRGPLP